jgi:hypothetical protein
MNLFQVIKGLTKEEAFRMVAMELAIELRNFRGDVTRNTNDVIVDAKLIFTYLETGI